MLTPLGTSLPHDLQGLPGEQQLDLACRTAPAVLLTFQSHRSSLKAKRDTFKLVFDGVQFLLGVDAPTGGIRGRPSRR